MNSEQEWGVLMYVSGAIRPGQHEPRRLVGAALALVMAACAPPEPASVQILQPADGDTVGGPNVHVVLEAGGVEITAADDHRAGTAHHHLLVDRDVTPFADTIPSGVTGIIHLGRGQTEFTLEGLEPGEHRVIAVLADWAHVPLSPPAVDTVRFTVRP